MFGLNMLRPSKQRRGLDIEGIIKQIKDPYGVLQGSSVIEDSPAKKKTTSSNEVKKNRTSKVLKPKNIHKKANDNNNARLYQKKPRINSVRRVSYLNTNVSNSMSKYGDPGYFASLRNPVVQRARERPAFRSAARSRSEERRQMSAGSYWSPIQLKSRSKRRSYDLSDFQGALDSFVPTFKFY